MNSLNQIALKLLVNDRGKFFTLIVGITFAVFLMLEMTSIFSGVMRRASANIINIGATMWVMDPSVNIQTDNIPLPSYILDLVRSIPGVKYAVSLYSGSGLVRLKDGHYQSANVIGIDDASLLGRPKMLKGDVNNIFNDDAYVVIKDSEYRKLYNPTIGTTFEINDHRGVVVGIGNATVSGIFGTPTLYTLYSRAITDIPQLRFTTSYILVEPKTTGDIPTIQKKVKQYGYVALTKNQFISKNTNYYLFQTGLGTNVLIMTIVSFIVGLSIAGQTFYTFVLEHLEIFGALKAIGAQKKQLMHIILFQSIIVGFLGYGFGVLLASVLIAVAKYRLPNYASIVTFLNLGMSFVMVILIIAISSYIGIRRVTRIDPFSVFRG